ncbi:dipeptidase [Clostridium sp. 'White wine YQ']|uniref:dipeptidase n=1 Tax=Clostridium sp. 'White wine YQ' TaxID=3027474 RepID=UPI0023658FB6|nr:dipeptidase [Clostridium sp. 'White wine YQ']MDD7794035.1 dipeptidase [Clostridium sp. 'White wine YQ']
MKFIDMHCDTPSFLYKNRSESLKKSSGSVDIDKLIKGEALCQFFAFFINLEKVEDPFQEFKSMFINFQKELNINKDKINEVTGYKNLYSDKIGALFTIEEGEVIKGDIDNLIEVYNLGIRGITLTWNYENSIGYPNYKKEFMNKGLKEFGIEVVNKMNELGMLIDTSHLSDGGFYDVYKYSKKPFIASHSNAREICNHPRNLTDDMIKILGNTGGVMGMNFCSWFLGKSEVSKIDDIIAHIKHIRNVGGIEVIALGSDFDGIENKVEIEDVSKMPLLKEALIKNGFKENEIEKIFYKNAERVIKEIL